MIYHHAITAAAAQHRTQDFIAQARADARANRPTKTRAWSLSLWSRCFPRRSARVVTRTVRRAASQ